MAVAVNIINPSAISIGRASSFASLSSPSRLPLQSLHFRKPPSFSCSLASGRLPDRSKLAAEAEAEVGGTLVPEGEAESAPPQPELDEASQPTSTNQTAYSVTVSPSDVLTMFFQAEGTINEAAIPTVTKALQEIEGISDLSVQVVEGIGSVQLTKQTTVQATGVASNLVEIIQSKGFKLQTLNLSFQDEEDIS